MRLRTLVATAAVLLAGVGLRPLPAPPTVVLLVRHAEKADQPAQDPPLTPEGRARAEALALVARDAGVAAIITTQYARTRETAAPVARATGITADVVTAGSGVQHPQAVASAARKHAGKTVLVVGHSNTIPAIVGALGAPRPPDLCDAEYDALFVVVIGDAGAPRLVKSRYGTPTPVGEGCAAMSPR
jgi:broad specificity phosphatase PhoE